MTFTARSLNALANLAAVAAVAGAPFAPIVGTRTSRRFWVRGAGYAGVDLFESAEERAIELLRIQEEEERLDAVMNTLAARA